MELQGCVIAKSLITEVECNLLPTRYRAINLQYLLARERNVIQNSICWVGGGDEHYFQGGKLPPLLVAYCWYALKRGQHLYAAAIPKDPKATSRLHQPGCFEGREWQLVPHQSRRGGNTAASTSG